MKKKTISPLTVLFAVVMWLIGVVLVLLVQRIETPTDTLLQRIGFAFIVAGVVAAFHETIIARSRSDETAERFAGLHEALQNTNTKVETCFRNFEESYGAKAVAIRLVTLKRAGYDAYHHWLVHTAPEDLFLAGHSVLHRIQIDLTKRDLGRVEERVVAKLATGSTIRLVFLDPTWDFIKNIAESEKQPYDRMMTDLAVTLGICRRLWTRLEERQIASGSVSVWMCREVQQYAFHSVTNRETGVSQVLVGLYFANILGMNSPLFSVDHRDIQDLLTAHFTTIADRATPLLEYSPPIKYFNHELYRHCRESLRDKLGESVIDQHCPQ